MGFFKNDKPEKKDSLKNKLREAVDIMSLSDNLTAKNVDITTPSVKSTLINTTTSVNVGGPITRDDILGVRPAKAFTETFNKATASIRDNAKNGWNNTENMTATMYAEIDKEIRQVSVEGNKIIWK
jgi:hypothetical protein